MTDPDHSSVQRLRIIVQDIRSARYCLAGVRVWFRRHGFDWQAFLAEGIDADRLSTTGDALVAPVIAAARHRVARCMPDPHQHTQEADHGRG